MTDRLNAMLPKLKCVANQLYAYYGGAVYLVGSALEKEDARDIDVRVVVSHKDFERLFGPHTDFFKEYSTGEFGLTTWRWAEDRLKRCRLLYDRFGLRIDFCCWDEDMWDGVRNNHLRLDTREGVDI